MSDSKSFSPNGIEGIVISVRTFDGAVIDITENVLSFTIFESIFLPFLFGKLLVMDNSAMLSTLPWIGQERVVFQWERNGETIEKIFYTTGVENVVPQKDNRATYQISITSESQIKNASSLLSKSYTLSANEIIDAIYSEFISDDLLVDVSVDTTRNVVFPYMKPFQAINTILKTCLADDQTPMFLFDRFYEQQKPVILTSYGKLFDQKTIVDFAPLKVINNIAEQKQPIEAYQVYTYNVMKAFKTLDQISDGAYSAIQRTFDVSNKNRDIDNDFYFKELAPNPGKEWIKETFLFDKSPARRVNKLQDSLAFDNGFSNLYDNNNLDSLTLKSFMNRFSSFVINASINPIAYTVEEGIPFTVGKTVDFTVPTFMPVSDSFKVDNLKNKILSGKYLITSIRHQMTGSEYTMSIELARDYIGEETIL